MAITKERKEELVSQYTDWLTNSKAVILTEYTGLTMKDVDALRRKAREIGAEFHVMKNTLGKIAFDRAEIQFTPELLEGSTAIAFAEQDPPALAKVITEFSRTGEALKIKGGYLDKQPITESEIKALAELPPLPVLRAKLLGTILAPASKLARIIAEPGRQVASVLRAYSEREEAPAAS